MPRSTLQLASGNLRPVYQQEFRHLDDEDRGALARIDRVTMAEWVHLLCEVRPGSPTRRRGPP